MKKLNCLFILFLILVVTSVDAQTISWTEIHPGVWKGIVGKPEAYDLLKAAGVQPKKEALAKIGKAAFPLVQTDIAGKVTDGKVYLRFPLLCQPGSRPTKSNGNPFSSNKATSFATSSAV